MSKQNFSFIVNVVTALVAVVVLSGSDCIIDPCPVLVRRGYDWTLQSRVASVEISEVSRLALSSPEQIALVDSNGGVIHLSELVAASVGQNLESGGRLIALFQGVHNLDLTSHEISRLRIVRIAGGSSSLDIRATAEWDIADCDERIIDDPWFTELDSGCGDGLVEAPEQCDDENDEVDDGCTECVIDSGGCTGDSWSYWTCEGEPSWCEQQECEIGGSDPACDLLADLELDIITNGLVIADESPGRIQSSPPGIDCSCVETAISYECDPSCSMDVVPCASLVARDSAAIEFLRWADGCPTSDGECSINVGGGRIIGVFDSGASGIEREREFTVYPLEQQGLEPRLFDANGGLIVVAGEITGELEDPTAVVDPTAEPLPFLLALDDRLEIVWSRDLVADDGAMTIMDVAVDGSGNTLLAVGLFGTLTLEGGTITVEDTGYPDYAPRGIVILKISPAGEHLWSHHVGLPREHDLYRAKLAVDRGGRLSLVAVVDYRFFGEDAAHDLIAARLSPEGEVEWIQALREEGDMSTDLVIDGSISTEIDAAGNVLVAAGVSGTGPFQYEIPEPMMPGEAANFLVELDSDGEPSWVESLPQADLDRLQMELDYAGRVVVFSTSGLASFDEYGSLLWSLENTPRTFDAHSYPSEPVQSFAGGGRGGDFVVTSEASTLPRVPGTEDQFLATVTSRFDGWGEHRWTVRRESWTAGRIFLFRGVVIMDDEVYVLGTRFLPVEAPNQALVVRRLAAVD